MTAPRRLLDVNSTRFYSLHIHDAEAERLALDILPGHQQPSPSAFSTRQGLNSSSEAFEEKEPVDQGGGRVKWWTCCPRTIWLPLFLSLLCLLLPSIMLLLLINIYRVDIGRSLFKAINQATDTEVIYVELSATILTNISSVSSTLAPFLIAMIMGLWSPFVAQTLIKASLENATHDSALPRPATFSILVNMLAGRCDQVLRYLWSRRKCTERRSAILSLTAIILLTCFLVAFSTFLGDQFFHILSESENVYRYIVPEYLKSFGRGLTPECIHFDRAANYYFPCTRDNLLATKHWKEWTKRELDVAAIQANTSENHQIRFLSHPDLPHGDLGILYPAPGIVPDHVDYHAKTLGVSTQCLPMTSICKTKHLSNILTQFNCTGTFFGVLGKPANISYDMLSKALDPDVPGLAWKISTNLEYIFYADAALKVLYNVMGYNLINGSLDENLPYWTDSQLVNPTFLSVAGRVTTADLSLDSTLNDTSSSNLFTHNFGGAVLDFFLNCSYTTYDVWYTIVNGTTLPDFAFKAHTNGSVGEMWHGRQDYVSLNGDPSNGLAESNFIAAKERTPEAFARTWANLYTNRVLAVIGAYTNPRLSDLEQFRDRILVTRVVPWTVGFLMAANLTYALLALVVAVIAWRVSTPRVMQVTESMGLNEQIKRRYCGTKMGDEGNESEGVTFFQGRGSEETLVDGGLRVGVVGNDFGSLYYAT